MPLDPFTQQVLNAMLQQNGAVPQGNPLTPPNFTMPGQGPRFSPNVLSGEGAIPTVSGNLPAIRPIQLPAPVAPSQAVMEEALKQAGIRSGWSAELPPGYGGYSAAPSAAESALGGEASGGLLKGLGRFVAPLAMPAMMAQAAMAKDPGQLDMEKDPIAAHLLNPSDEDTGASSLAKGVGRGAVSVADALGNVVPNAIGAVSDFFTKPKSAYAKAAAPKTVDESLNKNLPTIDDALGFGKPPSGQSSSVGLAIPGKGRNQVLDALESNILSNKPKDFAGLPPEFQQELEDYETYDALSKQNPTMSGLAMGAAKAKADLTFKQTQAQMALAAQERQEKWAMDAGKFGEEIEKEQREEVDKNVKIHASRGHFLIESNQMDEKGNPIRVIQPVDDAMFGIARGANGQIDPKASATIMGQKFTQLDKDPMGKEKLLLGNIEKDGQLGDIMTNPAIAPMMQAADTEAKRQLLGYDDKTDKAKVDTDFLMHPELRAQFAKTSLNARRGVLLGLMQKDAGFKQALINAQVGLHQASGTPAAPRYDTPEASALAGEGSGPGDDDWLSAMEAAQDGKGKP